MDRDLIKALIDALAASDLAELEYRKDGESLRLVKRGAAAAAPRAPEPAVHAPVAAPKEAVPEEAASGSDTIDAPLFGIVHLRQEPGGPPLVTEGQAVAAGQVVCLVEAMKVFNQISAARDCVIAAILVESGQEVEAGQPLFRLG